MYEKLITPENTYVLLQIRGWTRIMNKKFETFINFFSEKQGEIFSSPRALFGRGDEELFTIAGVDDQKGIITLNIDNKQDIIIEYNTIKEAILLLEEKRIISIIPEKIRDSPISLEDYLTIWQSGTDNITLNKDNIPYIADLIVLCGVAAYGWGRTNNGDKFAAIGIKEKNENEKQKTAQIPENINPINRRNAEKGADVKRTGNLSPETSRTGPVLITYSTRHGSTADIAWSIKNSFQDDGIYTEIKRIQDVDDVRKYSMVIIGTPIYKNKILPEAVEFTRLHRDWLSKRITAIFVVGISLREKDDEIILKTLKIAEEAGNYISPIDVGMFAGKILPENLPIRERINAMFNKEKTGDFRNWRDIGEWADKIKKVFLQKKD